MTLTETFQLMAKRRGQPPPQPPEPFSTREDALTALRSDRFATDETYCHATVCRWEATPAAILSPQAN